ncbi:MAG: hypothetical protein QNJ78_12630 [Gammaproteobacteria bacterium]|nr:hypothetical protein [Gammaproteobacteria bacterium]
MKTEISSTAKRLASMPIQQRLRFYRMKITQHTPPKTAHDRFMLKIYHSLLDQPDELNALEEIDQKKS